jgi:hypothetical protein
MSNALMVRAARNQINPGRIPIFPVTQPTLKSVNLPLISFGSISLIYSMTVA